VQRPTVVLVHGAAHGAWAWDRVVPGLRAAGLDAVALDLPGQGDDPGPILDLHGDAARVREVVAEIDAPVLLVGHSYGGAVITEAGTLPNVARLVYLAALPLTEEETCGSAAAADPRVAALDHRERPDLAAGFRTSDDHTVVRFDPELAATCFYNDCTPDVTSWAVSRLGEQSLLALRQTPVAVAWRTIPSTYVVCSSDLAIHPGLQRILAERCTESTEWPTGHSPFLSHPDLVVELLTELAT
jgi:pimeloyl-ACP methyl ester carboxylesterase